MNPWMYGWEFWLWMGPLLAVLFTLIGVAGYIFAWALDGLLKGGWKAACPQCHMIGDHKMDCTHPR